MLREDTMKVKVKLKQDLNTWYVEKYIVSKKMQALPFTQLYYTLDSIKHSTANVAWILTVDYFPGYLFVFAQYQIDAVLGKQAESSSITEFRALTHVFH